MRSLSSTVSHILPLGALAVVSLVLGVAFMVGVGLADPFELKAFAASVSAAGLFLFALTSAKFGFELDVLMSSSANATFEAAEGRRYPVANDR